MEEGRKRKIKMEKSKDKRKGGCNEGNKKELRKPEKDGKIGEGKEGYKE